MAKMTDKKPGKAKAKKKTVTKAKAAARAAQVQSVVERPAGPRQPGVERRRNHPTRARNGQMEVILTQAVPHVGRAGELVKVRPGFARNYLLPQGMATFATPHNVRIVEEHRKRLKALEEARHADLVNLAAQIAQRTITIEANANAEGHLYGSVGSDLIAGSLRTDGIQVEADNIKIEGPLKELGLYTIKIHLGHDVETEVKLWVVPTHAQESAT
jgi:large subunit ribosomal protein L9